MKEYALCAWCGLMVSLDPNEGTISVTASIAPPVVAYYHQGCYDPWREEVGYGVKETPDPVNAPAHYRWLPKGVEVIDITETLNFCMGNVIKYVLRADHKGKPLEDLRKAEFYLRREIANRESGK